MLASSPLSWILQLSFCCVEDLGVVEARDRPVSVERVCSSNSLQDGSPASDPAVPNLWGGPWPPRA